jgi:hypothetical protein
MIMKNCPYSEEELLAIAQVFKKHLKSLSVIQDIYPELNQDFIYKFKARFYQAQVNAHPDLHPLDAQADQNLHDLERELTNLTDRIRKVFQTFRYDIQKACPYGSEIWDQYGYSGLEGAIQNHSGFQNYLEGFIKLADEKRGELNSANCPTHHIDEIRDLSRQFTQKNEDLLEYIDRDKIRTKVIKNNLSELFKLMQIVDKAASRSFNENPGVLKYLVFPHKQSRS